MKRCLWIFITVFKWFFLIVMVVITLYPVFYALSGSLMTNQELQSGGSIVPAKLIFSNYILAVKG